MKLAIRMGVVIAALAFAPEVDAHAFLERATPAVGSRIFVAPTAVELRFTAELEPAFSTIKVLDKNGKQVDLMDKAVDSNDRTLLHVSLPVLPLGIYKVVWRVVTTESHATQGTFTFEVAQLASTH